MKRTLVWMLVFGLAVSQHGWAQTGSTKPASKDEPKHLTVAKDFVANLDLANTGYKHKEVEVKFEAPYESHTDCSGFIDALLEHTYELDKDQMRELFGSGRPTAVKYHDAIVEGKVFRQIENVKDIRPGDLLAIKYVNRQDATDTGHVMLAVDQAVRLPLKSPEIPGALQYGVPVIDSSKSGHGPTDTRHAKGANGKDHDGVGQGVFRIYINNDGKIIGFTWSTLNKAIFREPKEEHLVIGRLNIEALKPSK